MSDQAIEVDDLHAIATATAEASRNYLLTVREVASGDHPDTALSLLLLALSEITATGARLGAIADVVPKDRFEPDSGPEDNLDPIHTGLSNLLDGIDEYQGVDDPVLATEVTPGSLSGDLVEIASALLQGLRHYQAGRIEESLWWWQFSYLSSWGDRAAQAVRVFISLLAHLRLDAESDVVAEAEFDALHG